MKRRPPLWLLRDITATAAMLASLWALTWTMFAAAFTAQRRKRGITARERTLVYGLLAHAEETLDYLIMRQAHRLLGLSTHAVARMPYDPATNHATFSARFARYMRAYENIDATANAVADELRRSLNISKAEAEAVRAHALRRRACVPMRGARVALMVSSTRSVRQSNHDGVLTNARGPPITAYCRLPTASLISSARSPAHA